MMYRVKDSGGLLWRWLPEVFAGRRWQSIGSRHNNMRMCTFKAAAWRACERHAKYGDDWKPKDETREIAETQGE